MAKNLIRKQLVYSPDNYGLLEGTIQDIKKYLDHLESEVKRLYPEWTTIRLSHSVDREPYSDSYSLEVVVYGEREETDEELKARILTNRKRSVAAKKAAETREALKKEKDYQTFLKLQEKFKDV